MTVKRFKFVSPGVKINEIDRSVITTTAGQTGPVVVGRFKRGPGLVPTTVADYVQFDSLFGSPTAGVINNNRTDVWRSGDQQAPTYAAYASEAWLKNSAPLTVVRVLGVQHDSAGLGDGQAGWVAGSGESATAGGAWGLFIGNVSGSTLSASLAAVVYLATGSVGLVGNNLDDVSSVGSNIVIKRAGNDFEFKILIKDENGVEVVKSAVNFNKSSTKYIRKILNTNPVMTNAAVTPVAALKNYWLGETFETFLAENADEASAVACIVPLESGSVNVGNHLGVQAKPAKSGWIISQDLNSNFADFDPKLMPKLFRFSTLGGNEGDSSGEWEQKKVKISIEDVRPSLSVFNKYGSFTVRVREMDDTDAKQKVLETFSNLNLDPTSERYIARVIGDKMVVWDSVDERHKVIGNYDNRSSFIRVEMDSLLEQGALDPELLPFGFFGPPKFADAVGLAGTDLSGSVAAGVLDTGTAAIDATLSYPTIPLIDEVRRNGARYFGLDTRLGNIVNDDILDLVRSKPKNVDSYESDGVLTVDSVIFTLDDVSGSAVRNNAFWAAGSREAGESITAVSASATGSQEGYKSVLAAGFNQFTLPLFGGSDGFRINEKDPLCNRFLESTSEEEGTSNYAFYSIKRALDSVAEPEVLDMNLLTVPGVTNAMVADRVLQVCEERADSLAIIDIPGGYRPEAESTEPESERLGSVQETVDGVKEKEYNTSYACTYYPWVKVRDRRENRDLWVPPSVVALGTMASSQETSAVWFAPAGFNRGGLDRGSAGLTVTEVREVLKSKQRDSLYEVNVNPIARFPAEGIVIFGQKTLQATPSALDRINVRRMVLFLKKRISNIASNLLFDQNIQTTWQRFKDQVNPLMDSVKAGGGLADYKVILDQTTTTPDLIDRNTMYAKIFIKPAYAIEFIAIDFVITNSGASFNDL